MVDSRQFEYSSKITDLQGHLLYFTALPFPIPLVVPAIQQAQSVYRAITCTKIVNYHAFVDRVVVTDKGSKVSSENLAYDSETGDVIVTRTNNEFDRPLYQVKYPAWWAYDGMGLAGLNTGLTISGVNFRDGRIQNFSVADQKRLFAGGDEILLTNTGDVSTDPCWGPLASSNAVRVIWAFDRNRMASGSLGQTVVNPDFMFIDQSGKPYNRDNVQIRVIRSGRRNQLTDVAGEVTLMTSPIIGNLLNVSGLNMNVLNASAQQYSDRWAVEKGVFKKYNMQTIGCGTGQAENCEGTLETQVNPYRKGLLGNFRPYGSPVLFSQRQNKDNLGQTSINKDGFLSQDGINNAFQHFWKHTGSDLITNDLAGGFWIANANMVTAYSKRNQGLEEKNALNIYSSALYNENSTPNAIMQNAELTESFFESFENEASGIRMEMPVANGLPLCYNPKLKAQGPENPTYSALAHTGKRAMVIPNNKTYILEGMNIAGATGTGFSFSNGQAQLNTLNNPGALIDENNDSFTPSNVFGTDPYKSSEGIFFNPSNSGFRLMSYQPIYPFSAYFTGFNYSIPVKAYIDILEDGNYSISSLSSNHNPLTQGDGFNASYQVTRTSNVSIVIKNVLNQQPLTITAASPEPLNPTVITGQLSRNFNFCATKGRYEITYFLTATYSITNTDWNNPGWSPISILESFQFAINLHGMNQYKALTVNNICDYSLPLTVNGQPEIEKYQLKQNKKYLFSAWMKADCSQPCTLSTYEAAGEVAFNFGGTDLPAIKPVGPVIDGWQKIEGAFTVPANAGSCLIKMINKGQGNVYFDDIRIHPFNANMKSYVYDPVSLRLISEMDENNFATFFEYDEEGTLVRKKVETERGIKTIQETRSYQQKRLTAME
jgi:hypothetical protein